MRTKNIVALVAIVFVFLLGTNLVLAELPVGLQKIIEANQQMSLDIADKVTFLIAFLAGVLTLISPCILPLLPAFFAITFKEKKQVTKMTFIFFIGFALTFLVLGLVAAFIGISSITALQLRMEYWVVIAGVLLVVFGIMSIFGKGFQGWIVNHKVKHDNLGVFVYGILFAIGWTACVGPVLAGILTMATMLGNYFKVVYLILFYALGVFLPLFILSMIYDKSNLSNLSWLKGKSWTVNLLGTRHIHSTGLISGLLLIMTGLFFIVWKGTGPINTIAFGNKSAFYSIQDYMIAHPAMFNILGIIILIPFVFFLGKVVRSEWNDRKQKRTTAHKRTKSRRK